MPAADGQIDNGCVQVVNDQLQAYHDRQGIDMALAMSLRPRGGHVQGESSVPTPDHMHAGHARSLSWQTLGDGNRLGSLSSMVCHCRAAVCSLLVSALVTERTCGKRILSKHTK